MLLIVAVVVNWLAGRKGWNCPRWVQQSPKDPVIFLSTSSVWSVGKTCYSSLTSTSPQRWQKHIVSPKPPFKECFSIYLQARNSAIYSPWKKKKKSLCCSFTVSHTTASHGWWERWAVPPSSWFHLVSPLFSDAWGRGIPSSGCSTSLLGISHTS